MPTKAEQQPRKRDWSAAGRRAARDKTRKERQTLRYRNTLYTPPESINDPVLHLENKRGAYISRLEEIMDAAALDPKLAASIAVQLLKLSSLGKIKSDVGEALQKLMKEPDLTGLSAATLDQIISGSAVDVPEIREAIDVTPISVDDDKPDD